MAKRKSWFKENIINLILLLVFIGVASFFIYFAMTGQLQGLFKVNVEGVTPDVIDATPKSPTCTFSFDKSRAFVGEDVTGTITDGSLKRCVVAYNYENSGWVIYNVENLDINGRVTETQSSDIPGTYVWTALCGYFEGERFIAECRTNDATIEIIALEPCIDSDGGNDIFTFGHVDDTEASVSYPDECYDDESVIEYICDPLPSALMPQDCPTTHECEGGRCILKTGYNLGDIVGGSDDSGILTENGAGWDLDLSGIETGGPYRLGAKIWTDWDYVNISKCYGHVTQEGVEWNFYDSSGWVWQEIDPVPQAHYVELCPLVWDGTHVWHLEMLKIQGIPGCEIDYYWKIEIYVCE